MARFVIFALILLRILPLSATVHPNLMLFPEAAGYDEELFARRLGYDWPIATSLEVLKAVRRATVVLLERLTEEQWSRSGTHDQHGDYGMKDWLALYAAHAIDHAEQMRRARAGT